jgi:hypothetical protein
MRPFLLLLAFLLASPTASGQERLLKGLAVANLALAGADLASTTDALARNPHAYEANPLLRPLATTPWALGAVKMGGEAALTTWLYSQRKAHPTAVAICLTALIATKTTVVILNTRHR